MSFPEFVVKIRENSLKFPKPNKFFIIQFIFSNDSLGGELARSARLPLRPRLPRGNRVRRGPLSLAALSAGCAPHPHPNDIITTCYIGLFFTEV